MKQDFLIIDDFLPNAENLRAAAAEMDFGKDYVCPVDGCHYPGMLPVSESVSSLIRNQLARLFPTNHVHVAGAVWRLAKSGTPTPCLIHTDESVGDRAFVIYLSNPAFEQGGTAIWKHRVTGWESKPESTIISPPAAQWFNEEGNNPDHWILTALLPAKFNRLVSYPAKLFHSRWPLQAYGNNFFDGRLIIAGFFDVEPTYYHPEGDPGRPAGNGEAGGQVPDGGGTPSNIEPFPLDQALDIPPRN